MVQVWVDIGSGGQLGDQVVHGLGWGGVGQVVHGLGRMGQVDYLKGGKWSIVLVVRWAKVDPPPYQGAMVSY